MPKCISKISKRHLRRLAIIKARRNILNCITEEEHMGIPVNFDNRDAVDNNPTNTTNTANTTHRQNTTNRPAVECDNNINNRNIVDYNTHLTVETDTVTSCFPNSNYSSSQQNNNFKEMLTLWAITHKINHSALSDLLKLLNNFDSSLDLPKDSRSLLKTPRSTVVRQMSPGMYCHYGLKKSILKVLEMEKISREVVEIKINVDGCPIAKSSSMDLWPILGCVVGSKNVFCIGSYYGSGKPTDANEYLQEFVEECKDLVNNGLWVTNKNISIKILNIICDAPAKSYIKKTKGHGGYSSCSKCKQKGIYENNRMTFPEIECELRTDEELINRLDEEHQPENENTILLQIPNFGLVSSFPLDYMHLVCVGVVKKIILFWVNGQPQKLNKQSVQNLSTRLINLRPYIPVEFARRPRDITSIGQWKATELRSFLLYLAPVVLKGIVNKLVFNHFLTLHVAIRLLCNECHIKNYTDYARDLLKFFVLKFIELYGSMYASHNIHGLLHIVDDVEKFGVLDNFSTFPFENYLKTLKSFIRKADKPLQQLHRRLEESNNNNIIDYKQKTYGFRKPIHTLEVINGIVSKFEEYKTEHFLLKINSPDNICCINTNIVKIIAFGYSSEGLAMVFGQKFVDCTYAYKKPCKSSIFNTFKVSNLCDFIESWPIESINTKMVLLPSDDSFIALPLLHV